MCPDDKVLSALYDGEIAEPWLSRVQGHLAWCEKCRHRLQSFRSISVVLEGEPPDWEVSRERVWRRLAFFQGRSPVPLWRRRVAVPLPLLTAAVVFLLGVGFIAALSLKPLPEAPASSVWTVQFESLELGEFSEILKARDDQVQVFIELPDASPIGPPGEPQFIRAAEYRRR